MVSSVYRQIYGVLRFAYNNMSSDIQTGLFFLPHIKQQLISKICGIILSSTAGITETIKFGRLTFIDENEPVAFICSKHDKDYLEIGFFKAVYLKDPSGLFNGKGKEIRRIRISSLNDIPVLQIKRWVRESVQLKIRN